MMSASLSTVLLVLLSAWQVFAQVDQSCFTELACNQLAEPRSFGTTYKPCVLQPRPDGKRCFMPATCLSSITPKCRNAGLCFPPDRIFYTIGCYYPYCCSCPLGFTGEQCQWKTPKTCAANQCLNGGTCTSNTDGLFCRCLPGYGGWNCEIPKPCTKYPCSAGARCEEHNRGQKGRSCFDSDGLPIDDDI